MRKFAAAEIHSVAHRGLFVASSLFSATAAAAAVATAVATTTEWEQDAYTRVWREQY